MSCSDLNVICLVIVMLISLARGSVLVKPQGHIAPQDESLLQELKVSSPLTLDLLHSLSNLAERKSRTQRQLNYLFSSEEFDDDNDDVIKSAKKVEEMVAQLMKQKKKGKGGGSRVIITEADIDSLTDGDLKELERKLERLVQRESSPSTTVEGGRNGTTTTSAASGILTTLNTMRKYVNRRNILGVLAQTRRTVEYLEKIGLVDDVSAPITIGNGLLSGLEIMLG